MEETLEAPISRIVHQLGMEVQSITFLLPPIVHEVDILRTVSYPTTLQLKVHLISIYKSIGQVPLRIHSHPVLHTTVKHIHLDIMLTLHLFILRWNG